MLNRIRWRLDWWKYKLNVLSFLGGKFPRSCPICGYEGLFTSVSIPPRPDGKCPRCGSYERHRLFHIFQTRHQLIKPGEDVLHFAAEASLRKTIETVADKYVRADLAPGAADIALNIEKIELPDDQFDVVIASHVLEHVDDMAALSEIKRVLKPGGRLIAMIPIVEGWSKTYENNEVNSDEGRVLHFGQNDHIRYYGADFRDRILGAGYQLTEYTAEEPDVSNHSLLRGEKVFVGSV